MGKIKTEEDCIDDVDDILKFIPDSDYVEFSEFVVFPQVSVKAPANLEENSNYKKSYFHCEVNKDQKNLHSDQPYKKGYPGDLCFPKAKRGRPRGKPPTTEQVKHRRMVGSHYSMISSRP